MMHDLGDDCLRATRRLLMPALLAALLPPAAWAGTICGVVRDALTTALIPRAGVFVFEAAGPFTGLYAATDAGGAYCVANVPAGTYDLQVRVDDYLTGYVHGVVVTEDPVSVPVVLSPPEILLAPPWPNPARSSVRLGFSLAWTAPVRLSVFDARGRFVRAWHAPSLDAGAHEQTWDLTDAVGRPVPPGAYHILLEAAGLASRRTVIRIR
jgi:hypothetical protein